MKYTSLYLKFTAWRERHRAFMTVLPLGFIGLLVLLTLQGNRQDGWHDLYYAAAFLLIGLVALGYLLHLLLLKWDAKRGDTSLPRQNSTIPDGSP